MSWNITDKPGDPLSSTTNHGVDMSMRRAVQSSLEVHLMPHSFVSYSLAAAAQPLVPGLDEAPLRSLAVAASLDPPAPSDAALAAYVQRPLSLVPLCCGAEHEVLLFDVRRPHLRRLSIVALVSGLLVRSESWNLCFRVAFLSYPFRSFFPALPGLVVPSLLRSPRLCAKWAKAATPSSCSMPMLPQPRQRRCYSGSILPARTVQPFASARVLSHPDPVFFSSKLCRDLRLLSAG